MKQPHSKNPTINISSGTVVYGKWHHCQYKIIRSLGFGAQGTVYLAQSDQGKVALKFGLNNASVTSEVNVLNKLTKVQGEPLGPSLYDVDDWETNKGNLSFYAMEYLQGNSLMESISIRGYEWTTIFISQLLNELQRLHGEGWAFGDLKPENLMVTGSPLRVRWLDVGGTTQVGRAIKEYTEFYDRGYWGMGSRKAEPSYDLFAVAMIMIEAAVGQRFEKGSNPKETLWKIINQNPKLVQTKPILTKALEGAYPSAAEMRKELLNGINETKSSNIRIKRDKQNQLSSKRQKTPKNTQKTTGSKQGSVPPASQRHKKKKEWKGTLVLAATLIIAYVMYVTLFVM